MSFTFLRNLRFRPDGASVDAGAHTVRKIKDAEIVTDPIIHFRIDGFFKDSLFRDMVRLWPDVSLMAKEEARNNHFYISAPMIGDVYPRMNREQAALWRAFECMQQNIWTALHEKFEPVLRHRFGSEFGNIRYGNRWNLMSDLVNENYPVHVDHPLITFAGLVYLPDDSDHEHLGTILYAPKDPEFRSCGAKMFSNEEAKDLFREVCRIPYRPNSMFCFLNTPVAFHGVEKIRDDNYVRRTILYRANLSDDSFARLYGDGLLGRIKQRTEEEENRIIENMRRAERWPSQ